MARKLREDEAILIDAVLRADNGRDLAGGKTVHVQFASQCGMIIATVPGTIITVSPVKVEVPTIMRHVQILVSQETLQSVSHHFAAPAAHLPQALSAFLPSEAVVLGTLRRQHSEAPPGLSAELRPNLGD